MSEHVHDQPHGHAHTHQTHDAIIKRLKRADGHLRSIITMIDEGRECVDIAQLHAVEKAVCQAKRTLIQDHIDHRLEDSADSPEQAKDCSALDEFKQITKYL
jgi:DNA-binding FrmR family transcriptional regulator